MGEIRRRHHLTIQSRDWYLRFWNYGQNDWRAQVHTSLATFHILVPCHGTALQLAFPHMCIFHWKILKAHLFLKDFQRLVCIWETFVCFFFISQRHPDSPQSKSGLNSSCKEALVPMLSYSSITIIFYAIAHICFRKSFKNFERTRRMTCFEVVPLLLYISAENWKLVWVIVIDTYFTFFFTLVSLFSKEANIEMSFADLVGNI